MRIQVLFFAAYREIVGSRAVSWSTREGLTLEELVDHVLARYPGLAGHRGSMLLAVNHAVVDPDAEGAQAHDLIGQGTTHLGLDGLVGGGHDLDQVVAADDAGQAVAAEDREGDRIQVQLVHRPSALQGRTNKLTCPARL